MLARFAIGDRVRAMTGKRGTVVDPGPVVDVGPGHTRAGVRVALDWRAALGDTRPRRIRITVIYHPDDLEALP